ncbi:MAG: HK97-gp10 family putative phage morphogenesis protein [Butyricicoccaceae bacterium]
MSIEFDVSGLEDLAADLVRMGLKQSEIYDILTEALEPVKDEASRTIPKNSAPYPKTERSRWRTGQHLADNVTIERTSGVAGVSFEGGLNKGPYFYGRFGEYGTVKEYPRGWIQEAAAAREGEVVDILERRIKDKVED